MKKVVVIGSGPGGSACAALLANRGHDVTLLEQNDFIGGRCSTFEENGFMVDSGVHMFARGPSGPHGQVAAQLDVPQPWLVRDPSEAMWMNPSGFFYLHQRTKSVSALKELAYASITGRQRIDVLNTLRRSVKSFGVAGLLKELGGVSKGLPVFVEKYDDVTVRDFLLLFTEDEGVHRAINCLSMLLLVVPYDRSSAGEFIFAVSGIFRCGTLGVPRGGAAGVPRSFIRALLRDGGNLRLGVAAREIVVEEGRVKGVAGSDGELYGADAVVSSAGIHKTVELAGNEHFPEEYTERVNNLELSHSWLATKIACEGRAVDLRAPSFFPIPMKDPMEIFAYCDEEGATTDDPFLFVPMPTEWDSTLAPTGRQLIIMGVPTSNEVDQEERSQKLLDAGEKKLFSFFPEIERRMLWKSRITNRDTNRITRKGKGECIGLAQIPGQVGAAKPSPKTPVEGLWLVGCDAGARGVGTEQATASAMLVGNLVQ
jgi:phytoene dehydrogenase-like protein